jgi:hypothetical protein
MGTKISDLPVIGVLPADAVFPLEYSGANYSVKASDLGTGGSGGGSWSSGWVDTDGTNSLANAATLTFTHDLGTTDVNFIVYIADDDQGTNAQDFQRGHRTDTDEAYGGAITNITPTTVTVQLASNGYLDMSTDGEVFTTIFSTGTKHIKVVGISGGGSSSSGTTSAILPFAHARIFTNNAGTGIGMSWGAYNNGYVEVTFDTAQPDTDYYVVTDRETYDQHLIDIDQKTTSGFRTKWVNSDNSLLPPGTFGGMLTVYGSTPTIDIGGGSSSSGPRAYVAFDGAATNMATELAAANSHNIASITDNGVGDYTINFSTPVSKPIISIGYEVRASSPYHALYWGILDQTDSSVRIAIGSNNVYYDHPYVSFIAH